VCVGMYTFIHVYMYTYVYTCVCVYIYVNCVRVRVCVCVCVCIVFGKDEDLVEFCAALVQGGAADMACSRRAG
jgi:hypothetical protein